MKHDGVLRIQAEVRDVMDPGATGPRLIGELSIPVAPKNLRVLFWSRGRQLSETRDKI
jgi:hypothetical protein